MTGQIYASVIMGTTGNKIPVGSGFRFLGSGNPNYLENALGIYAYDGSDIIFEPKATSMSVSIQDPLMVDGSYSNFIIISITVIRGPEIVSGLSDITVSTTENKKVSITAVTAAGTAGSTDEYIWAIDGVEKQRGPSSSYSFPEGFPISEFTIDGSALTPGPHTITATVTTTLNSVTKSDTSTATITVGAATPTFTIGLTSFSLFSNRTKTITVAADNAITYTWTVDGVDKQTSASSSLLLDGSKLSAGDHTIKVTATNENGSTSSQTTFVVNPVILASVAKNSQNNTIHFPAGYLIRDITGTTFTDYSGSYTINSVTGTLTYTPVTDLVDQIITLSLYDPTDMTGNKSAVILISILQFPVFTTGLTGSISLRQNQSTVLSVVAESATQYAWFIDNDQKQSGASSSFSVVGSELTLGSHTIRVDASNSNGTVSSAGSLTILENLPAPNAPTNVVSKLESLTNIKLTWASSDLVQYTFNPTDDSTFVNATGSLVNIPVIVGAESGIQLDFYPLKPQYSTIRLRAINQNGTSSVVTFSIVMPYTIEKRTIGITDQYHITAFKNATPELNIIAGITHIYDQADTRGDLSIQSTTLKIACKGALTAVGAEAFKNCKALQSITFVGAPPVFTNFIGTVGYWNFFPDVSPAKVTVNYDSSIADWSSIVSRPDPISPYIEFSGAPYIYENLPTTATVKINTPYQLVAKAHGSPITYQWYRNGVAIAGAIASAYVVNESQYDITVNYSYKASNSRGEQTSTPITITFVTAPTINNPLESQSLPVLLDASSQIITMDVSGSAPIIYEWSINGSILVAQTSKTLTLTGAMLPLLGNNTLSFKATNAHGSVSSTATVVKVAPPTITGGKTDIILDRKILPSGTYTAGEGVYKIDMVHNSTSNAIVNQIQSLYFQVSMRRRYEINLFNSSRKYIRTPQNDLVQIAFKLYDSTTKQLTAVPNNANIRIEQLVEGSLINIPIYSSSIGDNFTSVYLQYPIPGFYKLYVNDSTIIFNIVLGTLEESYYVPPPNRYTLNLFNDNATYYIDSADELKDVTWATGINTTIDGILPATVVYRVQKLQSSAQYETVYTSPSIVEYTDNTFDVTVSGTSPITYEWKNSDGAIVGSGSSLTLDSSTFNDTGKYTYSVKVSNVYGSDTRDLTATFAKNAINKVLSFTADFGSTVTESYPKGDGFNNYTRIVKNPGEVVFSVEVSGYPKQKVEWLITYIDPQTLIESPPILLQTNYTTKANTTSEVFTYKKTYTDTPEQNEAIYVRVSNEGLSSNAESRRIYIDTPPKLQSGLMVYYSDAYTNYSSNLLWEARQFYASYSGEQKYTLLLNDIAIRNAVMYMTQRHPELADFYRKYCTFQWEYKSLTDTSYTPIDLTADYIVTADPLNPFMIVIENSKFPLLNIPGKSCTFRCTTTYNDPDIIGYSTSVRDASAKIIDYELNETGELIALRMTGDTITIPPVVTKISNNFIIKSTGAYIGDFYTGNARRVNITSIGGEVDEQRINYLKKFKTIKLHRNITFIGENAFGYNEFRWQFPSQTAISLLPNLTSIEGMPSNATIEKDAFANCPELEQVLFDST